MSLCDLVEDGKWYWAHSGEDLGAFAQWDSSEPNDVGKVPQRCVEIRYMLKKCETHNTFAYFGRDERLISSGEAFFEGKLSIQIFDTPTWN